MFRAPLRRLAAWLGLFALLMLFVAPVISTSLAQARAGQMAEMATTMPDMPMHEMPMLDMDHEQGMMPDGPACGYCVLLAHAPLLEMVLPLLFWFTLLATRPPLPLLRLPLPDAPPNRRPPARAPPLLINA